MLEPKYPSDAELIDGKWWTPKMVRHYWGLTPAVYNRLRKKYSLSAILKSKGIHRRRNQRSFRDLSNRFKFKNRSYSVAMVFYILHKGGYFFEEISYHQFRNRCGSHAQRNLSNDVWRGVESYCLSLGCNIETILGEQTQRQYEIMCEVYTDYISDNRPQEIMYADEYHEPNLRYVECLKHDKRMLHIYYTTVEDIYPALEQELKELREKDAHQAMIILQLKDEIIQLQQELFNAKRPNAIGSYAPTETYTEGEDTRRESEGTPESLFG